MAHQNLIIVRLDNDQRKALRDCDIYLENVREIVPDVEFRFLEKNLEVSGPANSVQLAKDMLVQDILVQIGDSSISSFDDFKESFPRSPEPDNVVEKLQASNPDSASTSVNDTCHPIPNAEEQLTTGELRTVPTQIQDARRQLARMREFFEAPELSRKSELAHSQAHSPKPEVDLEVPPEALCKTILRSLHKSPALLKAFAHRLEVKTKREPELPTEARRQSHVLKEGIDPKLLTDAPRQKDVVKTGMESGLLNDAPRQKDVVKTGMEPGLQRHPMKAGVAPEIPPQASSQGSCRALAQPTNFVPLAPEVPPKASSQGSCRALAQPTNFVPLAPGIMAMLGADNFQHLNNITNKSQYGLVSFQQINTGITIDANPEFIADIVAEVEERAGDILTQDTELKIWIAKYFLSPRGSQKLREIEQQSGASCDLIDTSSGVICNQFAKPTQKQRWKRNSKNTIQTMEGIHVSLVEGSIVDEQCDVIVITTSEELDMKSSAVGRAVLERGGSSIQDQCHSRKPKGIKIGDVFGTNAGNLQALEVYHTVLCAWDATGKAFEIATEVLLECLLKASRAGYISMAIPAFGTGNLNYPYDQTASLIFEGIAEFSSKNDTTSLKDIRVVLYDKDYSCIDMFGAHVESLNVGQASPHPAPIAKHCKQTVVDAKPRPVVPPKPKMKQRFDKIVLRIYAMEEESKKLAVRYVDHASREITGRCAFERQQHKQLIKKLSASEIDKIRSVASKYDVLLEMDPHLLIEGETKRVHHCFTEITDILNEVQRQIDAAAMLYKQLKWQYQDCATGTFKSYSMKINHTIETARIGRKPARWSDKGGVWSVDFDTMTASLAGSSGKPLVIRKTIEGADTVNLPRDWLPTPPGKPFRLVSLQPASAEYRKVHHQFHATCDYDIVEVQRIQCPAQYQCYTVKKQQLMNSCRPGTQVERPLFHGTSPDILSSINTNGFNRSYCGKNMTLYGEGVYFAVDANYSADPTYSIPDRNGNSYMYLCRVITGEYTKGDTEPNIRYNSVVNNMANIAMFVIFQDMQAYPEYLITFRSPYI